MQGIKGNFFITSTFLEKNNELVLSLLNEGHTAGNLSDNEDYNSSDFVWMKTVITNAGLQDNNYCYAEDKDEEILEICKLQSSRTIIPTKIIDEYPLTTVKSNLKSGAMFSFEVNEQLKEELPVIINYIESKGFKLDSLEELLAE